MEQGTCSRSLEKQETKGPKQSVSPTPTAGPTPPGGVRRRPFHRGSWEGPVKAEVGGILGGMKFKPALWGLSNSCGRCLLGQRAQGLKLGPRLSVCCSVPCSRRPLDNRYSRLGCKEEPILIWVFMGICWEQQGRKRVRRRREALLPGAQ